MCYDMARVASSGGGRVQATNIAFAGEVVLGLSFLQLVLGLIVLAAQIGYGFFCDWAAECILIPIFIPSILIIIASCSGIFAAIERTNCLIWLTFCCSLVLVILIPINMGLWGLPDTELPEFRLTSNDDQNDTLTAITWGLLLIPVIEWILFVAVACLACMALCCPSNQRGGNNTVIVQQASTGVYSGLPAVQANAGVYAGLPAVQQTPTLIQSTGLLQGPRIVQAPWQNQPQVVQLGGGPRIVASSQIKVAPQQRQLAIAYN